MNSEMISIIEQKRNKLRNIVLKKGIFASKIEKETLEKYEELLLNLYSKLLTH